MDFVLDICQDKTSWDRFIDTSPQGNIFCLSFFLDALGKDYDLWLVKKNGQVHLGAVILKDEKGEVVSLPVSFSIYQGLLFSQIYEKTEPHSRISDALKATDFLLVELEKKYNRIFFSLHHKIEDLRSFFWFNYNQPRRGHFKVVLQYTGIVDLGEFPSFDDYLQHIRTTRRYEYRKAIKDGLIIEDSQDIEKLDYLHELTYQRQGIQRNLQASKILRNISAAALSRGLGELLLCADKKQEILSATLYLYYKNYGYYLVAANNPAYRDSGSGTLLMLENIRRCKERGIAFVDVCGINSPNRGDFKTSFNAFCMPYFYVVWEKPNAKQ